MLYITTKNSYDVYTSNRALHETCAPDGGDFAPLRLPVFSPQELSSLLDQNASEIISRILTAFFGGNLTGWDVQLCIGQKPVTMQSMPHKIHVAELWNNPYWSFDFAVEELSRRLGVSEGEAPGKWLRLAVMISFLFCAFSEMKQRGIDIFQKEIDVSVPIIDFSAALALLYGKKMGLPVGRILCGCNENNGFWELINHNQFRTGAPAIQTETPLCDETVPAYLDHAVYLLKGVEESRRFCECAIKHSTYFVPEGEDNTFSDRFYAAVIGKKRMLDVIASVYATNRYLMDSYAALAFGAVQDYRATGGNIGHTMVLSLYNYADHRQTVAKAIGVDPDSIRQSTPWG